MAISVESRRKLKTLAMVLWVAFLCYGLVVVSRFQRQLLAINKNSLVYIGNAEGVVGGGLCALLSIPVYLIWARLKVLLPVLVVIFDCLKVFSPILEILQGESFGDFIQSEPAYVQKHSAPINFVQDGKTYSFGICGLVIDSSRQIDANFVYDTSHNVRNCNNLLETDKIVFVKAIREHFHDDPNEQFENAYFTATKYYHNFIKIVFDDANSEGFVGDFGIPSQTRKIHIHRCTGKQST